MEQLLQSVQLSPQERIAATVQMEQTLASYADSCQKGCGINENNRRMLAYDQSGGMF